MQTVNELTRFINIVLAFAVLVHQIYILRKAEPHTRLSKLFPMILVVQIICFTLFAQFQAGVDVYVLNWLSQVIRAETLLYFLLVHD